jgi:A/G-specific adenine glycosylase
VGLGYNRRALRLRDACVAVARDGWPVTASGLRALPGVGPYTAAAVASFAFDEQVAAVDVNVARVSARLGTEPAGLVPEGRAASFNHAMMDLGATICTARRARCEACPVARLCPSEGVVAAPVARGGTRQRFEDTDRFARGRIVAALAAGEALPGGLGEERTERALAALVRDGLVVRDGDSVRLP